MTAFGAYLRSLVTAHGGTKQDFARALGIRASKLSRLFTKPSPPSVELCFQIAALTRTSPTRLLRLAQHTAIADWIEDLYTPTRPDAGVTLTGAEQSHLTQWRRLTNADRAVLQRMIRRLIEADTLAR
jgi:transcriptional regulator with XRE-family HTH domain